MATAKKNEPSGTPLSADEAREKEAEYRSGVDISLYELADCFERDGYDWRQALKDCGYSDDLISVEVDSVQPPAPPEPEPEPVPEEQP